MNNTLVTSKNPQIQAIIDVVGFAATQAAKVQSENLTTAQRQRILAQGDELTFDLIFHVAAKMSMLSYQFDCLKLISGGRDIIIGGGKSKKKTKVQVFKIVKDRTFAQIFGAFGENLDRLCFDLDQIKLFVKYHSKWLNKDGCSTNFFLSKVKGEISVFDLYWVEDRFRLCYYDLSETRVWDTDDINRCILVPQL